MSERHSFQMTVRRSPITTGVSLMSVMKTSSRLAWPRRTSSTSAPDSTTRAHQRCGRGVLAQVDDEVVLGQLRGHDLRMGLQPRHQLPAEATADEVEVRAAVAGAQQRGAADGDELPVADHGHRARTVARPRSCRAWSGRWSRLRTPARAASESRTAAAAMTSSPAVGSSRNSSWGDAASRGPGPAAGACPGSSLRRARSVDATSPRRRAAPGCGPRCRPASMRAARPKKRRFSSAVSSS